MLRDHEKITPHACEHCQQSFGLASKLRTHIANVHQKVKCDECNQVISGTAFMLKRHKAKAHGKVSATAHECDYCSLVYEHKTSLEKHIAKHHSNIDNKPLIKHYPI